jgi:ferric-dicitrate binding protein FerR (iron transport regulator)
MNDLALLHVLDGESSPEERAAIHRWLEESESNRAEFDALRRSWKLASATENGACDERAVWDRLSSVIEADAAASANAPAAPVSRGRQRTLTLMPANRPSWRRPVAGAALLAAGAAAAFLLAARIFESPASATDDDSRAMRVLATARGEHAEIRLPDGSRVVLNASSTLKLPMAFDSRSRELYLDGEAYFEVKHEPERPFNIHTTRGLVQDRGTRFVIVAYSTDSVEHVAVQEGEVAIRSGGSSDLVLRAGEVGSVSSDGTVSQLARGNPDDYTAWMDGRADFDNVTLAEAIRVLERQFDIDVRVTDSSLARKRFSASINGANVDRSMRALAFLLDARYQRAGPNGAITLAPR